MVGNIRNIRDDKDYAFIVSGNNRDIFLHKEQFEGDWDDLRERWRIGPVMVQFDMHEAPKGLRAINCRMVVNA